MIQQLSAPTTETELRETLDTLYEISKEAYDKDERPTFYGLIEIMSAKATIITAIHNIKANHGSKTPGVDGEVIRTDYLQRPMDEIVEEIQRLFKHYVPRPIRRVYIDKPGKAEKRPLGIPAMRDRIMQECMRIVLEPIAEAQFFQHSYGFRPMRDTSMALQRAQSLCVITGYQWIVEGDISKCFDNINHTRLIKRLYHIGIKDQRVLQIIKAMLKAGIMGEAEVNERGVAQGSVIGPLLANIYMDIMDEWIAKQWENKKLVRRLKNGDQGKPYCTQHYKVTLLKTTKLHPAYLIRFADDFLLITDTKEHAIAWKERLRQFLQSELGLTLSEEKTLITSVRRKSVKFLGFELKLIRGRAKKGYVQSSKPNRERLKKKVHEILARIKAIKKHWTAEKVISEINLINSMIRGLIQYYSCCTMVYAELSKFGQLLTKAAWKALAPHGAKWTPAKETTNLPKVHEQYKTKIPAIRYKSTTIGMTSLGFCKWEMVPSKNLKETPYTDKGRELYFKRAGKRRALARLDELYSNQEQARALHMGPSYLYNFEYLMNRAYALNRDKVKCKICGKGFYSCTPMALHLNPHLPLDQVNRVNNLASVHPWCYRAVINPEQSLELFDPKAQKKICLYRKKREV